MRKIKEIMGRRHSTVYDTRINNSVEIFIETDERYLKRKLTADTLLSVPKLVIVDESELRKQSPIYVNHQ